jgi:hypothetical protein
MRQRIRESNKMATSKDRLATYPEPGWTDSVHAWLRREIAEQGVSPEHLDRATIWVLLGVIEHLYRQLDLLEAHRPTGPLH